MSGYPVKLSPREFQVIRCLALGMTYERTATELGISRFTVNRHRFTAGERSGAGALVDILRALGWLRVPDHMSAPGELCSVTSTASGVQDGGAAMTPARSTRRVA